MSEVHVYRNPRRRLLIGLGATSSILGLLWLTIVITAGQPWWTYLSAASLLLGAVNSILSLRPVTEIHAECVRLRRLGREWRVIDREQILDVRLIGMSRSVNLVLASGEHVALPWVPMERLGEVRRRLGFEGLKSH